MTRIIFTGNRNSIQSHLAEQVAGQASVTEGRATLQSFRITI